MLLNNLLGFRKQKLMFPWRSGSRFSWMGSRIIIMINEKMKNKSAVTWSKKQCCCRGLYDASVTSCIQFSLAMSILHSILPNISFLPWFLYNEQRKTFSSSLNKSFTKLFFLYFRWWFRPPRLHRARRISGNPERQRQQSGREEQRGFKVNVMIFFKP